MKMSWAGWATIALICAAGPAHAGEFEFTGYVEPELQLFLQKASRPEQPRANLSVAGEVSAKYFWDDGDQSFVATPFMRLDMHDDKRTHADLRALKYAYIDGAWEFRAGIDKVFWGVTEAVHLVDIINQTDMVEDVREREKLGQPLVSLSTYQRWGTVDLYVLPWFRERLFPGANGRPATDFPIDTSQTKFESGQKQHHVDFAARYANTFDIWDVGFGYFRGTGRKPILIPGLSGGGSPVLIPYYAQIDQLSTDIQATKGAWLYKFEGLWRKELNDRYLQGTGGIEYTLYGLFDTPSDLGIVAEYIWDERGANPQNPFANDLFAGLRWTANDIAGTSLLTGAVVDLDTQATFFSAEFEKRLGQNYRLSVEARLFTGQPASDPYYTLKDDDFLQIRLARYF